MQPCYDMEATRIEYAARLDSPNIFDLARTKREAAIWRAAIEHGVGWCDAEIAWLTPSSSFDALRPRSRRGS